MAKKKERYFQPKITVKKVEISFFLSKVFWTDQFNFIGQVYAQSGGSGGYSTNCGGDVPGTDDDCAGCSSSDCGCGTGL